MKMFGAVVCAGCLVQGWLPAGSPVESDSSSRVSSGRLRGNLNTDGVAVFRNIPFAQPPVGDLRWKEPVVAKP